MFEVGRVEKQRQVDDLIKGIESGFPVERREELGYALHAFFELNLLKDLNNADVQNAIRVWAVVEKVRRDGFPDWLRV